MGGERQRYQVIRVPRPSGWIGPSRIPRISPRDIVWDFPPRSAQSELRAPGPANYEPSGGCWLEKPFVRRELGWGLCLL